MRQSPTILGVLFSLLLTNAGAHAQQPSFSCSKTDECMRVFSENGNNINLQLVRALLERLSLSVVSFEFVSDGCFIEGEAVTENQDITIVATSGSSLLGRRVGGQVRRSTALFISEPQVRCSIVDVPPPNVQSPARTLSRTARRPRLSSTLDGVASTLRALATVLPSTSTAMARSIAPAGLRQAPRTRSWPGT
jgi:hypothetical protein